MQLALPYLQSATAATAQVSSVSRWHPSVLPGRWGLNVKSAVFGYRRSISVHGTSGKGTSFLQGCSSGRRKELCSSRRILVVAAGGYSRLELTEENIDIVLQDAREELFQIFDPSVGITGTVTLADLDGPVVKLRLQGRFWHKRSDALLRIGTYLQQRIPEVLQVEIEDESQLDDSRENF